jgi:poly(A) polymerase Pap1
VVLVDANMTEAEPSYLGVSPPYSLEPSSEDDIRENARMLTYLKEREDVYEKDPGQRESVIQHLTSILKEWAMSIGIERGVEHAEDGGGIMLKIFGSTR